mgnify:CR=1 FL=1|jgi:hypothetical protein
MRHTDSDALASSALVGIDGLVTHENVEELDEGELLLLQKGQILGRLQE